MSNVAALLESMWGWRGYNDAGEVAPRYFRINPDNHSGRRLYRICGSHNLLVTNCCRIVQRSANDHGKPDPQWVIENLGILNIDRMDLLLVCGKVARETFEGIASIPAGATDGQSYIPGIGIVKFYMIDHPAARRWSIEKLNQTQQHIERLLNA